MRDLVYLWAALVPRDLRLVLPTLNCLLLPELLLSLLPAASSEYTGLSLYVCVYYLGWVDVLQTFLVQADNCSILPILSVPLSSTSWGKAV